MKTKNSAVEKKFSICHVCKKKIAGGSYKLKAHLYIKHKAVKPRHRCAQCGKEYFRSDLYSKHVDKHRGAPPKKCYTCDDCGRSYINKRNLVLHLQVHNDFMQSKYKCAACDTSYCEARLLKYHIRKNHFNLNETVKSEETKGLQETWVERVKQSEVCVQITKINTNVVSIEKVGNVKEETKPAISKKRIKNGFKDYMTSAFAQNDNSQYSKAKCDYCAKEMLKKSLLSHIRERHLKLRKFKCEVCARTFKRHYQLVDHACGKERRRRCKVEG